MNETLEQFKMLADEMNRVMGLAPKINIGNYDDIESLKNEIINHLTDDNGKSQIYDDDYIGGATEDAYGDMKFSTGSWNLLKKLKSETENQAENKNEKEKPEPQEEKKSPKKKSKKKKQKKDKYSRFDSFVEAIETTNNVDKIIEMANYIYVKHGGKSNLDVSKQHFMLAYRTLKSFGLAIIENNILHLNF